MPWNEALSSALLAGAVSTTSCGTEWSASQRVAGVSAVVRGRSQLAAHDGVALVVDGSGETQRRARSLAARRSPRPRGASGPGTPRPPRSRARPGRGTPPRQGRVACPAWRASAVVAMHVITAGSGAAGSCGYSSRSRERARVRGQRPELAVRRPVARRRAAPWRTSRTRRDPGRAARACAALPRAAAARAASWRERVVDRDGEQVVVGERVGIEARACPANGLRAGHPRVTPAQRVVVQRRSAGALSGGASAPRATTGGSPSSRGPRPPSSRTCGGRSADRHTAGSARMRPVTDVDDRRIGHGHSFEVSSCRSQSATAARRAARCGQAAAAHELERGRDVRLRVAIVVEVGDALARMTPMRLGDAGARHAVRPARVRKSSPARRTAARAPGRARRCARSHAPGAPRSDPSRRGPPGWRWSGSSRPTPDGPATLFSDTSAAAVYWKQHHAAVEAGVLDQERRQARTCAASISWAIRRSLIEPSSATAIFSEVHRQRDRLAVEVAARDDPPAAGRDRGSDRRPRRRERRAGCRWPS